MIKTDGPIYNKYANNRADPPYDDLMRSRVEETVKKLIDKKPSTAHPGMLLGKIQSGKTRTFLGVIALAFENGYDVAIVLTKNSKPLAAQTLSRIISDLCEEDVVQAFDIMSVPPLQTADLDIKNIFVSKKEDDNIERLNELFKNTCPELRNKRVLIVDDEADYGSVGFRKVGSEYVSLTIPKQLDDFRTIVPESSYLQVTATPNALYLQPEEQVHLEGRVFKPLRPSFTTIVPTSSAYVGTDYFFENCNDPGHPSYYSLKHISDNELKALSRNDGRRLSLTEVLTSNNCAALRNSLLGFIVGAIIRRISQEKNNQKKEKYCFLVHTQTARPSHDWQELVVNEILKQLNNLTLTDSKRLEDLIKTSYNDIKTICDVSGKQIPDIDVVVRRAIDDIGSGYISAVKVNSDNDVKNLLDAKTGELRRGNFMNIFIGGQVLDRGLTIKSLIGFYYGRSPKFYQQDTVLQHMRLFGYRPIDDLCVTCLYTGAQTRQALINIHSLDVALREGIEKNPDAPVVYVEYDPSGIIKPCNPSRLIMSETSTFRPHTRHLPVGFNTAAVQIVRDSLSSIESRLSELRRGFEDVKEPFQISMDDALQILRDIEPTLEFEEDADQFKIDSAIHAVQMMCDEYKPEDKKVWIYPLGFAGNPREVNRKKMNGTYSDAPDTGKTDTRITREFAIDHPGLMLIKMKGERNADIGWKGQEFIWPVLIAPRNSRTVIFAHKTQKILNS